MITKVTVNHTERSYFNDYDELRTDEMAGYKEWRLLRAIDKLYRRYRTLGETDCIFVTNDDDTGYRLMYQRVVADEPMRLMLRHYTSMAHNGWDKEEAVSSAKAKRVMSGKEQM